MKLFHRRQQFPMRGGPVWLKDKHDRCLEAEATLTPFGDLVVDEAWIPDNPNKIGVVVTLYSDGTVKDNWSNHYKAWLPRIEKKEKDQLPHDDR